MNSHIQFVFYLIKNSNKKYFTTLLLKHPITYSSHKVVKPYFFYFQVSYIASSRPQLTHRKSGPCEGISGARAEAFESVLQLCNKGFYWPLNIPP